MTPRDAADELLIHAIARGLSYEQAAKTAGVSPSTADRRMRNPEFAARVETARAARVIRTADQLSALAETATGVLLDTLQHGTPALKVRVALAIPALAAGHREVVALEQRLAALEDALRPARHLESA